MVRTQISLTEEQLRRLRHEAADHGTSIAAIIRMLVERHLQGEERDRDDRLARALSAAGCFASGQPDLAEHHDHYLNEAGRW